MPDTTEAPATTEQPAAPVSAPAAPAVNNQPESPSPFADGTGWDQIQRNDLVAKPEPPKEFVFADGKKITDIDYRKPLQAEAPPPAQTEPAKSGDTSATSTETAKPTELATTGDTSSATAQSGEQDFSGLLKKYGTDQNSWAKAFAGLQKQMSKQAEAIKAYQTTLVNQIRERAQGDAPVNSAAPTAPATTAPDKPAAPAFDKSAEMTSILELLGEDPAKGIEKLVALTETIAEQKSKASAEAFWQSEQAKQTQAQQARQEQEIKANNESMVWNRVREMKLAAAQAANDKDAIARYSNEKYQIDEADYIDVMPSIQAELDFIDENNMLPKDGKLSPALFKRVQLLLDPPDIQKIISEAEARAEARTRAQVLAEISKSQNANGQRVSIQPAANTPIKSNEVDLTKYEGWHPTDIQNEVFANMSDDAIAAAKEKFMQSYNRAAA